MRCHDCYANPGEFHMPGCDMEICQRCGGQAISCDCIYIVNGIDPDTMEEYYPEIWANGATDEMHDKFNELYPNRIPYHNEDLVEQLRDYSRYDTDELMDKAADELERLQGKTITRLEVIDHTNKGRFVHTETRRIIVIGPDETLKIELSRQDEGRTLKVFITDEPKAGN